MKIIYFSNSTIPSRTANSIHVMKMCSAFASNGNEVVLIAKKSNERILDLGNYFDYYDVEENFKIKFFNSGTTFLRNMLYSLKSALFSKFVGFDVVYSRNLQASFFSILTLQKTIHESHSPEDSTNRSTFIFKMILKSSYLIYLTVISKALKILIQNKYNTSKKIVIAHDGADIPKNINKQKKIKQFNSNFNVVYIGHLYKGRGIDLIIKIAKVMSQIDFHIIGGNDGDLAYWKKRCKNLNNIIFYGFIQQKELKKFRQSSDILIAPYMNKVSVSGGKGDTSKWMSPLKVFEYMAAKKPIIISEISVLREILNDDSAVFCNPNKTQDWIDAIIRIKNNPKFSDKISSNAYKKFIDKYSWESRAKRLISLCK